MRNCPMLLNIIISQASNDSNGAAQRFETVASPHATAGNGLKLDASQRQHMCSVIHVNLLFLKTFAKPLAGNMVGRYRNRSCPAVSQICSLTVFPPTLTTLEPNSTPMVWLESCLTATVMQREESVKCEVKEQQNGLISTLIRV